MEHNIQPSNFYYHIRRFREMACDIPKSTASASCADTHEHEIVEISFDESMACQPDRKPVIHESSFDVAVRIHVNDFQVDVSNHAAYEKPS